MKNETRTIIESALGLDGTVPALVRRQLVALIHDEPTGPEAITEREAARLLAIGHTTLGRWRRGLAHVDKPFPLRPFTTPAGRVKYRRREVEAYACKTFGDTL
jgi:hypothetical protein